MRLLQLGMLLLLATAARADFFSTGDASILDGSFAVVQHDDSSCSLGGPTVQIFAQCSSSIAYGDVSLSLLASGPDFGLGFDNWGAENEATVGFTDQIMFYGPVGGTGVVLWDVFFDQETDAIYSLETLPSAITFNVPYFLSLGLTASDIATSDSTRAQFGEIRINGFQLFSPSCDPDSPDSCGPPIDVSIHTASGFLYGGHAPEPSSLLLLATAAVIAWLVRRSRRRVGRAAL
jgi:hypothetical protein